MVDYLSEYTKEQIGLTMGVSNFVEIFDEQYYKDVKGGILEAFGKMFHNNLKVYLYPMKNAETGEIINSNNLKLEHGSSHLIMRSFSLPFSTSTTPNILKSTTC
jgi:hypothetical protein